MTGANWDVDEAGSMSLLPSSVQSSDSQSLSIPSAIDTPEDVPAYREVKDDLNVQDETEDEHYSPARFRITSYGADLSVFDLRRRLGKEILIPAPFQRKYVWTSRQASRFIESILLGLPVPGIFVYLKDKRQLIVDGQQRLITLDRFLSGTWETKTRRQGSRDISIETPFSLVDVDEAWEGRTFYELEKDDRDEIENYLIHATIFKQEHPKTADRSIYEVFERINTGGMRLSAQEIRACVSHGSFSEKLGELADDPSWRKVYGVRSPRLKDEELILRFIALFERVSEYKRPMRVFLDEFLESKRDIGENEFAAIRRTVVSALNILHKAVGPRLFRPEKALNAAVFDAIAVGCAVRLLDGPITDVDSLKVAYDTLIISEEFRRFYQRATADEESVRNRIELATNSFRIVA